MASYVAGSGKSVESICEAMKKDVCIRVSEQSEGARDMTSTENESTAGYESMDVIAGSAFVDNVGSEDSQDVRNIVGCGHFDIGIFAFDKADRVFLVKEKGTLIGKF